MTQPNPFTAAASGGFAPPAPAPAAPAQAPVAAPAAPAPAPAQAPAAPVQQGTPAFGHSTGAGSGEKHRVRDYIGQPLLIRIKSLHDWTNPQDGSTKEVADVDWIVLDPANAVLCEGARIFNGPIVRDLRESADKGLQFHVGRVAEVSTKRGLPALVLSDVTPEEEALAVQAGQAFGWWA